jgi:hypothetical protein
MTPDAQLLAVDLGLRCGWAAFAKDGRLLAYGSRHFGSRATLRKAVPQILDLYPSLSLLVIEGGGDLFVPWEKEAARRSIPVKQVSGEEWRKTILLPWQRRTGKDAKAAADGVAREVIERSGAKRPTSLRHDAAEAILVGAWAATSLRSPRDGPSRAETGGRR